MVGTRIVTHSAAVFALLVLVAACGDEPAKVPVGSTCGEDTDCASGLCYAAICLDPASDDDGDGLINGFEIACVSSGQIPRRIGE